MQGNTQAAQASMQRALDLDPNDFRAVFVQGLLLSDRGAHKAARERYRTAYSLHPGWSVSLQNIAISSSQMGDFEAAVIAAREGCKLFPKVAWFHHIRGRALNRLSKRDPRKLEQAIEAFERAIDIDDQVARFHWSLGRALAEAKRFEEAITAFHNCVGLDPDDAESFHRLGVMYHNLRRPQEALTYYLRATELDPEDYRAFTHLGAELGKAKRTNEAIVALKRATEIDNDHALAFVNLSAAYLDAGQLPDSFKASRRAIVLDDKNANAFYNLACAYALNGDKDEAFENLWLAQQSGYRDVDWMNADEDLDSLRKDPRYADIEAAVRDKKLD